MIGRVALSALGLAALGVGIWLLRDATISRDEPVPAGSVLTVTMEADREGGTSGQTLAEMTQALVLTCRLEVETDPVGPVEQIGDDRFRVRFRPALDDTDRSQLRGCLEDWRIDHFLVDVVAMDRQS